MQTTVGNVARIATVLAAVVAAAGSATSSSNDAKSGIPEQQQAQTPPPPQQMEPARALGLWRSTFGAVKIEADNSKGGISTGAVQGVWVYQRQGQEVVGYFAGNLRGNVLDFRWQEPNNPPLTGSGYLVFDPQGRQYAGRWWSDRRDRIGDWNGWRQATAQGGQDQYGQYGQPSPDGGQAFGGEYGGQAYGYQPPPQRYPQQRPSPYAQPRQPTQYPQQPSPYAQPRQPTQYPQQPWPYAQPRQPTQSPQQPAPYGGQPQPQPYYPQQPAPPPPAEAQPQQPAQQQPPAPSPYY